MNLKCSLAGVYYGNKYVSVCFKFFSQLTQLSLNTK